MLSPMWASPRITVASVMVREVPPPPVAVSSWGINDETAVGYPKSDSDAVNVLKKEVLTCFPWFLLFR